MTKHSVILGLLIGLASTPQASAGGMSIGAPSIQGLSPGLSQRCLHKLGSQVHGAQAARAVHECRKPDGPQSSPPRPALVAARAK